MATEPKFTSYTIKEGDRFDTIAQKAYGTPAHMHTLISDNPHIQTLVLLPKGETIWVRVLEDPVTGNILPPWFADEEVETPDEGAGGGGQPPVTEGPIVPLGFAQGFPKVAGNRIQFAINRSGRYPYTVAKKNGTVIFQSSGYDFSSGFPVETPDIVDAGLYVVTVGPLVSADITIAGTTALAFTTPPFYFKDGANNTIRYAINKTGAYLVKITRLSDNYVEYNLIETHTSGVLKSFQVASTGMYKVEVSTLTAEVPVNVLCERSPTFEGPLLSVGESEIVYRFDAASVFRMRNYIEKNGEVLRSAEMVFRPVATPQDLAASAQPGKPVQFFDGNVVTFQFDKLDAQTGLLLKLTATSCSGGTDSREISIAVTPLAFEAGYPRLQAGALEIRINKTDSFLTIIKNLTTNVEHVNTTRAYIAGTTYVVPGLPDGQYSIKVGSLEQFLTISSQGGVDPDPPLDGIPELFKTTGVTIKGKYYTMIKSAGMDISINPDTGYVSDVTPGLGAGTPYTFGGRNCFWKLGARYYGTSNDAGTIYKAFQNVNLPVGTHTIRRFDCKADLFPNQAAFEAGWSGYPPSTGVNNYNCTLSEVTLSILEIL